MSIEKDARHEHFRGYAEALATRFKQGVLTNLQEKPFWVVWKREQDSQGKLHKRPYSPKNFPTSIYKPRQWASLETALEAVATGTFAGIGLMLPTPYVLIDKDATANTPICDPNIKHIINPLALSLLKQVPSYAELSPNNGLHIITEGTLLSGNFKTEELELYTNWFATVTTRHIPGTPLTVTNQQAAIEALEAEFHREQPARVLQNTVGGEAASGHLQELPPQAKRDTLLQELLQGDMHRVANDQHLADWMLLMKLLHWTGDDILLVKSIFLNSPLGQRDKAKEPAGEGKRGTTNYLDRTIDRILQKRQNKPMDR